jgi:di/tricarboxylate transporter
MQKEITALIVILMIVFLYKGFNPVVTFLIAVTILTLTGIITPLEALSGFSNEQIATLFLILIISGVISEIGVLDYVFNRFLILRKDNYMGFLVKMMFFVSGISSFIPNTPVVAILAPYVYNAGKKNGIPPSKLLIPLSYSAILGGTITLIGTSTNLIVNSLYIENGGSSFKIFDFSYVGIPLTIIGILYMILFGRKFLPEHKDAIEKFIEKPREYIVEAIVHENSHLIGKSIENAGLRNLKDLFLVEIIRGDKKIAPVSPSEVIENGDVLIFAGDTSAIVDFVKSISGLVLRDNHILNNYKKFEVVEVVVSWNSSLIGRKIRKTDFRARYDSAILAVHRYGEKLGGKIGEIELKAGDVLLLLTGKDFVKLSAGTNDFFVISKIKEIKKIDTKSPFLVIGGFFFSIILSSFGIISLFKALLALTVLIIVLGLTSLSEIKRNIDLNIIFIASFGIAIGKGIIKSGLAEFIADRIFSVFYPLGIVGILFGIFLITVILTELITNSACVTIVFPIANYIAISHGFTPTPFILAIAYAASASFITPFGYQTNLIIYGPGSYKFKDFVRVGFPLTIIYMFCCILFLKIIYF